MRYLVYVRDVLHQLMCLDVMSLEDVRGNTLLNSDSVLPFNRSLIVTTIYIKREHFLHRSSSCQLVLKLEIKETCEDYLICISVH
jgi:hypothetical protein